MPVSESIEARQRIHDFNKFARGLSRNYSADADLYWETGQMHLGVALFEVLSVESTDEESKPQHNPIKNTFWPRKQCQSRKQRWLILGRYLCVKDARRARGRQNVLFQTTFILAESWHAEHRGLLSGGS